MPRFTAAFPIIRTSAAAIALMLGNAGPASAGFIVGDYLPLEVGFFWEALQNGTTTITTEVVRTEGTTFVLQDTGGEFSGSTQNLTNDANGLRLHQLFISDPVDPDITAIFTPALTLSNAEVDAGDVLNFSGGVSFSVEGFGTFGLDYSATSNVIGLETVTVPFGTFDALRIDSSFTISGTIDGMFISETSSGTDWLGFRTGFVKSISDGDTFELVNTNVPEPSTLLLFASGLAGLALQGRRRASS